MGARKPISNIERSPEYGVLQAFVDSLFADRAIVRRIDAVVLAEAFELSEDLLEIVMLLPPGEYGRQSLCDQLNSALAGHAWGQVYGTVA